MSIVELISPGESWGGIEQHILDLTKGLSKRGHKITFATRDMEHATSRYREAGEINLFPVRNALDFETIFGVAALIRKVKADIIHTHTSRDAWMAVFASMIAGRGKVVTTRHVPLPAKRDRLHKFFYDRLAAVFCVSNYVRDIFLGAPPFVDPEKVKITYPVISLDKFGLPDNGAKALRLKWGMADNDFVIGFVGRITVEKGLDDLIGATALLKDKGVLFKLALVGQVNPDTPEYLEHLKDLTRLNGLEEYVVFEGFTTQVNAVMQAVDCLVIPSVIPETFGLALCEAAACGKPVIASNTGAQGEIVQDGVSGFIVPPGQPENLATALYKLVSDPRAAQVMGECGRRHVAEQFASEQIIVEVENHLSGLAHRD